MRSASRRTAHDNPHETGRIERGSAFEGCDPGSSGVVDVSTATWRTLSCACAVKGNAAAARYTYECRTRGPQVDFLGATDAHAHRRGSSERGELNKHYPVWWIEE